MQIKTTSGSGAGAFGIIGTGLALALPDAKWIGWTLVVIGFFVFVFDIHLERGQLASVRSAATLKQRFKRMWPQYLMVVCGIGFFVGLVAFLQLNAKPSEEEKKPEVSAIPAPQQPSILPQPEALLDFGLELLPRVSPASGAIPIFDIREEVGKIEAYVVNYQMDPSVVIDWRKMLPEWPVFGISKCEITSATQEPIFNAIINLDLGFQEMVPDPDHPGQSRSGKLLAVQKAQFRVGRISPHESYVLYFVNRTKYLVNIVVPPEGIWQDFSVPGPDFEKKIRLRLGRTEGLHLMPTISLPAQPLPTPEPPNKPERK